LNDKSNTTLTSELDWNELLEYNENRDTGPEADRPTMPIELPNVVGIPFEFKQNVDQKMECVSSCAVYIRIFPESRDIIGTAGMVYSERR
jgi:hypothetical protein